MQTRAINPTDGIYPATSDYVHAMEVSGAARLLFVAGTMGLDEAGKAPPTIEDQLRLIWNNIRRILAEADMTTANIMRLTSYLSDASYAEANARARVAALAIGVSPRRQLSSQHSAPIGSSKSRSSRPAKPIRGIA